MCVVSLFVCCVCVCALPVDVKICTSFVVHACKCFVDLISFRKIEKLSIENSNNNESKQAESKCFICLPHTHTHTLAARARVHCVACAKFVLTATKQAKRVFPLFCFAASFSCCFYNTNNENPFKYVCAYVPVLVCVYVCVSLSLPLSLSVCIWGRVDCLSKRTRGKPRRCLPAQPACFTCLLNIFRLHIFFFFPPIFHFCFLLLFFCCTLAELGQFFWVGHWFFAYLY